ncbi:MAG: C39 family peptidase [Treponema sp.]|nr:C39 family peptidase [Treponema sp.]
MKKAKSKSEAKAKGGSMVGRIIFEVVKFCITAFIITNIVNIILMGTLMPRFERHAKGGKYFVSPSAQTVRRPSGSYFEFQQGGGCAGFSSAFVLRHSGVQIGGEEAFKDVPFQMKGGMAFPKGISGFFKKRGIKMTACTGNFAALQNELEKGRPVIVVIRSFADKNYLHFATVTGYDEEKVYLADSIQSWVNVDKDGNAIEPALDTAPTSDESVYYNRTVSLEEFKKLWNTSMLKMPLYKNMFFVMK